MINILQQFVLVLAVVVVSGICVPRAYAVNSDLRVRGRIVAYSILPGGYNLNTSGAADVYIFKVSRVMSGKEQSKFIVLLVNALGRNDHSRLGRSLDLRLKRMKGCDRSLNQMRSFKLTRPADGRVEEVPRLKAVEEFRLEEVPGDEILPCYTYYGNL